MTDIQVALFPDTHISQAHLSTFLDRFQVVVMCVPWFMDLPVHERTQTSIRVFRPPEALEPPEDFGRLLSEYREWMRQNQDTDYATALASSQDPGASETNIWELRQILRNDRSSSPGDLATKAIRWHLILHLTREFQEHQLDIQALTHRLKQQAPPLSEALGEGSHVPSLLEDLPEVNIHPFGNDQHLKRVCEAWIGLFGDQVANFRSLATVNRCVTDLITDLFQARGADPVIEKESFGSEESASGSQPCDVLYLPDISGDMGSATDPVRDWLSGRRIILCAE